jgi:hypothetical protein
VPPERCSHKRAGSDPSRPCRPPDQGANVGDVRPRVGQEHQKLARPPDFPLWRGLHNARGRTGERETTGARQLPLARVTATPEHAARSLGLSESEERLARDRRLTSTGPGPALDIADSATCQPDRSFTRGWCGGHVLALQTPRQCSSGDARAERPVALQATPRRPGRARPPSMPAMVPPRPRRSTRYGRSTPSRLGADL